MNKIKLSLFAVVAFMLAISSCTKEKPNGQGQNPFYIPHTTNPGTDDGTDDGGGGSTTLPVGDVPLSFTKKVLIEEFTGEWCGWCPEGAVELENIINANPNTVIGVAVHDGDFMEVASFNSWIKGFVGVSGYPNGTVDRRDAAGRGSWSGQATTDLKLTAVCGLAMDCKETGGIVDLDVYVGYNAPVSGTNMLSVYIIEDGIAQKNQSNYSSSVVVDANWKHNHVFRGLITGANDGDAVTLNSAEKYTKVSFPGIDLSSMNIADITKCKVVAFVHQNSGATTNPNNSNGKDVLNVQECGLNETKNWD